MRLGVFGGSFDPVHYGHLLLAEYCREACRLEEVWFMPAGQPPHKRRVLTPAAQRLEMLELAVGGHDAFRASRLEIDRPGLSFTVDTLASIHDDFTRRGAPLALVLLLGGDSYRDLPSWREPSRICELAELAVVDRAAGAEGAPPQPALGPHRVRQVTMPRIDLASREIRRRTAAGASIRYQTPRAVEQYILHHRLYREAEAEECSERACRE